MNKCKIVFLVGKKMVCNLPCLNTIRDIHTLKYGIVSSTQHTMWIDLTFVSKCFNRIWLQKASLSSENYLLPHVIIGSPYVRVSKTNHNRGGKILRLRKTVEIYPEWGHLLFTRGVDKYQVNKHMSPQTHQALITGHWGLF